MRYLDVKLTLGAGILDEGRPCEHGRLARDAAGVPEPRVCSNSRVASRRACSPTGQEPKKVLRAALREWLPASILDRPKQGFAMPLGRWFRGDLQGLADSGGAHDVLAELVDPRHTAAVAAAHRRRLREDVGAAQPRLPPALAGEVVVKTRLHNGPSHFGGAR